MVTNISQNLEETLRLGESWGNEADTGWVFGFSGELGAGKTQLVRGIARGLGYSGRVHSPTFAILHTYNGGRFPIAHLDLYRLNRKEEIIQADLSDHLENPDGISLVEWYDRWCEAWEAPYLAPGVRLRRVLLKTLSENAREISHEDFGA